MAKEIKCYRCGKVHELTSKNIDEIISCGHCHGQMILTKKSRFKAFALKYFLLLAFVFLVNIVLALIGVVNFTVMMILVVIIGISFTVFVEKPCVYLTYRYLGGDYEEYHPVDPRKNKNNKKSKKQFKDCLISNLFYCLLCLIKSRKENSY